MTALLNQSINYGYYDDEGNDINGLGGDSDIDALGEVLAIVVPILFGIIVIVGLFGNALVVIVVLCNQQMRSTTNLLIINLAIADLLFIVFCVPFTAWDYAFPHWIFGDIWCRVVQYLIVVCAFASIYTLVLMSLDRFLAVVHPIASISIRTERNAYRAIILTWVTILVLCVPALIAHGAKEYELEDEGTISQCRFNDEEYNKTVYQVCFFLSSYVVPLSLVFVLYVLMLKRLWFGTVPGGQPMSSESVRSKKRVTRMVVVVVVIFAVCWMPIQIILVLKAYDTYELTTAKLITQIVGQLLAYMNSCVNPILYAFLSENFRKAFNKVIACNTRDQTGTATIRIRREETTAGPTSVNVAANEITMGQSGSKVSNGNV